MKDRMKHKGQFTPTIVLCLFSPFPVPFLPMKMQRRVNENGKIFISAIDEQRYHMTSLKQTIAVRSIQNTGKQSLKAPSGLHLTRLSDPSFTHAFIYSVNVSIDLLANVLSAHYVPDSAQWTTQTRLRDYCARGSPSGDSGQEKPVTQRFITHFLGC